MEGIPLGQVSTTLALGSIEDKSQFTLRGGLVGVATNVGGGSTPRTNLGRRSENGHDICQSLNHSGVCNLSLKAT